jgi:hypothetical protein
MLPAALAQAGDRAEKLGVPDVKEFRAAYQASDGARFAASAAPFHRDFTNGPGSSANSYWLVVRHFYRMLQLHTVKERTVQREASATWLPADKRFVSEAGRPTGPLDPRWGHTTCSTFIGRTYGAHGVRTKAADYFRRALVRPPTGRLAKEGLALVT